jgi:uncharacterized UPF0160 family protein
VSLLRFVFGPLEIIRTRDPARYRNADFVLDVGGVFNPDERRFDHHHKSYRKDLASAGMVLEWLNVEGLLDSTFVQYLNNIFIKGVDRQDIGLYSPRRGICTFSDIISLFNPSDPASSEEAFDRGFQAAFDFTFDFLNRLKNRYIHNRKYLSAFRGILSRRSQMPPHVLICDEYIPWKEYIHDEPRCHDVLLVIYPVSRAKWILHTVPRSLENPYASRILLPKSWAGMLEGELVRASGIPGAIFCHKQRFMAAFKTKQSAIRAAESALSRAGR